MKLSVCILAWNHWADTRECIETILRSDLSGHNLELVLIDNGSSDGTAGLARALAPDIHVIGFSENRGIQTGYNAGLAHALAGGADFAVIMNNDIALAPDLLWRLADALERHPDAAIAVPKIVIYDEPGRVWSAGAHWRPFPPEVMMTGYLEPDAPEHNIERTVAFATSCCLMIRCAAIPKAGMFDPAYIFYQDDWDFCWRYRDAGYSLIYTPTAVLRHKVSVSTQNSEKAARWWHAMGRDLVIFYMRRFGWTTLALAAGYQTMRSIVLGRFGRVRPFAAGVRQGLRDWRAMQRQPST